MGLAISVPLHLHPVCSAVVVRPKEFENHLSKKPRAQSLYLGELRHWLRDAVIPNGRLYYDLRVEKTRKIIEKAYNELMRSNAYSHSKLLSEMEFGVWKYMFSNVVYALMGQSLLHIFPNKPTSTRQHRYDNSYIFQELDYINKLRNRIAHHEPICFSRPNAAIDTSYALNQYARMMRLFNWMGIDGTSLMFGLDHVGSACSKIMCL